MRSPCHNPGRSGRGERARCSARACCAGWGRAAGEMRVGGPHGRGTLLRPCELCNPARLGTQIPGVVQPGATLSVGLAARGAPRGPEGRRRRLGHRVSYFPRNAVVASRWCPVRSLGTKTPFQPRFRSRSVHVPITTLVWGSRAGADGSPQELTPLGLVGVSLWRPLWVGTPPLEPAHDRTVGRVHCPPWLRWSPRVMVSGPLPAPGLALGDKMVARPAPCGRG